jgi:hypothetical protein
MKHRNFVYRCEIDHDDDVSKIWHYAINCATQKRYGIDHSPYSYPTLEQFATEVDKILLDKTI